MSKRLVVLSGAGISAESGLRTFRDSGGLWEGYRVEDVATPEAWSRNPELVTKFYNERRRNVLEASPNAAHLALVELEKSFQVTIITQNIDDLHERAGSSNVIHLHGEIRKARSSVDPDMLIEIEGHELKYGALCPKGSKLRPHVVWFGEAVPMMDTAIEVVRRAEIFLIIGTSLVVYPAAGLVEFVPECSQIYFVDPSRIELPCLKGVVHIKKVATEGMVRILQMLSRD